MSEVGASTPVRMSNAEQVMWGGAVLGSSLGSLGAFLNLGQAYSYKTAYDEGEVGRAKAILAEPTLARVEPGAGAGVAKSAVERRYVDRVIGSGGASRDPMGRGRDIVGSRVMDPVADIDEALRALRRAGVGGVVVKAGDWHVPVSASGIDEALFPPIRQRGYIHDGKINELIRIDGDVVAAQRAPGSSVKLAPAPNWDPRITAGTYGQNVRRGSLDTTREAAALALRENEALLPASRRKFAVGSALLGVAIASGIVLFSPSMYDES